MKGYLETKLREKIRAAEAEPPTKNGRSMSKVDGNFGIEQARTLAVLH